MDDHGTHTAGTIAAPINGIGVASVAPRAEIVVLKAGTELGYVFTQSVVDALMYAGDQRLDVVHMSFFADPWLFKCERPVRDPRIRVRCSHRFGSSRFGTLIDGAIKPDPVTQADAIDEDRGRVPGFRVECVAFNVTESESDPLIEAHVVDISRSGCDHNPTMPVACCRRGGGVDEERSNSASLMGRIDRHVLDLGGRFVGECHLKMADNSTSFTGHEDLTVVEV